MNTSQSPSPSGGVPPPGDDETAALRSRERCLLVGELSDELAHQLSNVSLQVMGHSDDERADELRVALQSAGRAAGTGLDRLRLLVRILSDCPALDCTADIASLTAPTPPSAATVRSRNRLRECGLGLYYSIPPWVDDLDPTSQRTLSRTLDEAVDAAAAAAGSLSLSVAGVDNQLVLAFRLQLDGTGEPPLDLQALAERVDLTGGHLSYTRSGDSWEVTLTLPCTIPDASSGPAPERLAVP